MKTADVAFYSLIGALALVILALLAMALGIVPLP
jgi:uncharacterized membrane protein